MKNSEKNEKRAEKRSPSDGKNKKLNILSSIPGRKNNLVP